MLSAPSDSATPRSDAQIVEAAYERASVLRRCRSTRRWIVAGAASALLVAVVVTTTFFGSTATAPPSVHQAKLSKKAVAGRLVLAHKLVGLSGTQPPQEPVGTGWSAAVPSVTAALQAQYPQWAPLVTSALKVFEHETQDGKSVTLSAIEGTNSTNLSMTQGPYAGSTVTVDDLEATVEDASGQQWSMSATSQSPFSAGGSVLFRSQGTWTTTGTTMEGASTVTQQTGTVTVVEVGLVGSPRDPTSATVAEWNSMGSRSVISFPSKSP